MTEYAPGTQVFPWARGTTCAEQTRTDLHCSMEVSGGPWRLLLLLGPAAVPIQGGQPASRPPPGRPTSPTAAGLPPGTPHGCSQLLQKTSPEAGTCCTSNSSITWARREGDSHCTRHREEQHHLISPITASEQSSRHSLQPCVPVMLQEASRMTLQELKNTLPAQGSKIKAK